MNDQELSSVFLFKLDQAGKQFRKYKNRVFRERNVDITGDQWILLKNIHEAEGINQSELAERCQKEAAAVTRTLDLLEKKGWISRQTDPNSRRMYNLFTTAEGKQTVKLVLPIALEIREQASNGIDEQELAMFNRLLDKIANNLV